jgi:hypothetical protein
LSGSPSSPNTTIRPAPIAHEAVERWRVDRRDVAYVT